MRTPQRDIVSTGRPSNPAPILSVATCILAPFTSRTSLSELELGRIGRQHVRPEARIDRGRKLDVEVRLRRRGEGGHGGRLRPAAQLRIVGRRCERIALLGRGLGRPPFRKFDRVLVRGILKGRKAEEGKGGKRQTLQQHRARLGFRGWMRHTNAPRASGHRPAARRATVSRACSVQGGRRMGNEGGMGWQLGRGRATAAPAQSGREEAMVFSKLSLTLS